MPFKPYWIASPPFYIVPALHYTMELAVEVRRAFLELKPDCVAVELPENLQEPFLRAASRLPDLSVVTCRGPNEELCFPVEPCEASFEAIRSAQEAQIPVFCIDLDVTGYPKMPEMVPDPYAITKIGLQKYYQAYAGTIRSDPIVRGQLDKNRELYMAKRLRELSFSYEKILVIAGMSHVQGIYAHLKDSNYPSLEHVERHDIGLYTYTETAVRELMAECPWVSCQYEAWRDKAEEVLDRQELYYQLLKLAQHAYTEVTQVPFAAHVIPLLLKFSRNWAHIRQRLLPDFFQLLGAAKACVDHNFAYEVWKIATDYPHYKNIDSLPERPFSIDEIWGGSKRIQFHLKNPSEKSLYWRRLRKDQAGKLLYPPSPFSICSYPPEDSVVEKFGLFLKKKGLQQQTEEGAHTIPFSNSIEDGIDVRETIRHWAEKKLYVKARGRPPGMVGSCVVIFDEDTLDESKTKELYPCKLTWLGEHEQESDMAFYSTSMTEQIVGPGIVRCIYGGFMLSFPAKRLYDVWSDPDYVHLENKHEVLLAAAIDYSRRPVIVYVGLHPPTEKLKAHASRQGKRILYLPIAQFGKHVVTKLRTFHILDGRDKRAIADEYIY